MPSTDRLKIALAQLNPTVGDIAGNVAKLIDALATARGQGADLLVTPELYLAGYPAEDLVLEPAFLEAIERAVELLRPETAKGTGLLVGVPWRQDGKTYNAALLLERGELRAQRFKHELANQGVFDEKRTFAAGPAPGPVAFRGVRLGVMIGDDMATPDAAETLEESGAQLLIVLNGSPFDVAKQDERLQWAVQRVTESGLALVAVNQVGGQDELVFDGASFGLDRACRLRLQAPSWQEAIVISDWLLDDEDERWGLEPGQMTAPDEGPAAIYQALMLGLRDFAAKNRFTVAPFDPADDLASALTTAIAIDALGSVAGDADLILSADDKTAVALGHVTGGAGFAVLKDCWRTGLAALARWRNEHRPNGALGPVGAVIPVHLLADPSVEELALDDILASLVERVLPVDAIVARGHALETVMQVWRRLDRGEYKRRQAPLGVKTTRRAFGRDRRYPITNYFRAGE
jgi:predicted amidohydrolase